MSRVKIPKVLIWICKLPRLAFNSNVCLCTHISANVNKETSVAIFGRGTSAFLGTLWKFEIAMENHLVCWENPL